MARDASSADHWCALLLAVAKDLHVNGQETEETVRTVEKFGTAIGVPAHLSPSWGLVLVSTISEEGHPRLVLAHATPSGVAMNRVKALTDIVSSVCSARMPLQEAQVHMAAAAKQSPSVLWLYILACSAGASALGLIFGVSHTRTLILITACAGLGAILRRWLATWSIGNVSQAFFAALLAGLTGGWAVHWHLSSELQLIAVCPCMILVPGPHLANGTLDCLALRLPLGAARLLFAASVLLAICAGLLLGLYACGVSLPTISPARHVALWIDVLAAGIAAGSYGIYFSMPVKMLIWPACAGMLAHTAHWWLTNSLASSPAASAGIACLLVGTLLIPVAHRLKLPFAAIGFASVVSLMPGIFIFRMSSGLLQLQQSSSAATQMLLSATISNGVTAFLIIVAIAIGLVLPKHAYNALSIHRRAHGGNL